MNEVVPMRKGSFTTACSPTQPAMRSLLLVISGIVPRRSLRTYILARTLTVNPAHLKRAEQVRSRPRSPAVMKDHLWERKSRQPTPGLEHGPLRKAFDETDAQVGDGNDPVRDSKNGAKRAGFEDAHPPDAETFCACSKPEILDGAAGTIDRGFRHRIPSDHCRSKALLVARHT